MKRAMKNSEVKFARLSRNVNRLKAGKIFKKFDYESPAKKSVKFSPVLGSDYESVNQQLDHYIMNGVGIF